MNMNLKKQMEVLSKILKWGGLAIAIILLITGFSIINNISDIKELISMAVGYFGNEKISSYISDMISSFDSLGWLVIFIGMVLGGVCYGMSLILKGQILILFNGQLLEYSTRPNIMNKIKNVYNATKELSNNSTHTKEDNDDLKI